MRSISEVSELCAACGKGGDNLKTCSGCKSVKYCNRSCQLAHRKQHKKICNKRAAELFDEALFKQPPCPRGDCPICMLRLPVGGDCYQSCCGKFLCIGCISMMAKGKNKEDHLCPFCRLPISKPHKEMLRSCKNRMEAGDLDAFILMGRLYLDGKWGLPQDNKRGLELFSRAAELGSATAHYEIGLIYANGRHDMGKDTKKALYHYQQAAMRGSEDARYELGCYEVDAGNMERALKHYMIAVGTGHNASLDSVRSLWAAGFATKAEYERALREYQICQDEVHSDQREKALAYFNAMQQRK